MTDVKIKLLPGGQLPRRMTSGAAGWDCAANIQAPKRVYAETSAAVPLGFELEIPPGWLAHVAPPDGAFYLYADIGHLTDDSVAFCTALLRDTGVCTAPGVDFDPVDGRRFIRFSFAVSTAEVREAITRMVPWFARQTPLARRG